MTRMPLTYAEKKKSSIPRKSYARFPNLLDVPNLIEVQLTSFQWLQEIGLKQLLDDISNKRDEDGVSHALKDLTGNRLELSFAGHEFREPRHSEQVCRQRGLTFSAPLYVRGRLLIKATGEIKEQDIFFGEIPQMTAKGTFVISGAERVVVSQLLRSPGVYFFSEEDPNSGRGLCRTKLIPDRGAWLEFETSNRDVIVAKIDGKRKIPVTTFLRAIGYSNDEELLGLFANEEDSQSHHFIRTTMGLEPLVKTKSDALIDIYRKVRPNDPPNIESAKKLIKNLFFNPLHYSLGKVGRYKLNKRLGLNVPEEHGALTKEDIVEIVRRVIMINNGTDDADDIDHLGNRRVRTVGELVQKQFRIGLLRLERVAMERMSVINTEAVTPSALINVRPIVASITEFFNSSQLSQFMDQTNPLAELTHKRRLSAMGPGGLTRERAGFEVRDVHFSHYGRICPIETPEGPNIGLIGSLATYSLINKYGFIETPYRKIYRELENSDAFLLGKTASETIKDDDGKVISKAGTTISPKHIDKLNRLSPRMIKVAAFVSNELEYLSADREDVYSIAQANAKVDKHNQLIEEKIEARHGDHYLLETNDKVNFMDVSPKQLFSIATALIPFLEHNDANRALMGANMQRQAMPLVKPEAPLIATGMELEAAEDSGQVVFAQHAGMVTSSTASKIVVTRDDGEEDVYPLSKYVRTNQGTCINQHPVIRKGDRVEAGRVLADSSATEQGELALGQNILCAFMSWEGYNYEDAIIISNRLVREDNFTSIHIERHETEARDTKLGPEEITRDIPNVGEESLRELDETGVVRIGAEVKPGDILVGKITPKGETELSAEEKLLRAIFGEKAREVKDTSLRVPHGEWGKAIDVRVFSRDAGDDLPAGVNERVQVWIAQRRQISVGDKLAGRHGNKGVVSIIAPVEDMPFLEDGTPIDMILNPIGVPSRMNIGQVLEAHLGWAAQTLGFRVLTPVFDGATDDDIEDELARAWVAKKAAAINTDDGRSTLQLEKAKAWVESQGYRGDKVFNDEYPGEARSVCLRLWLEELGVSSRDFDLQQLEQAVDKASSERNLAPPTSGKVNLCDGRTGEALDQPVTVGNLYMVKLIHLVEDKVHARSTGPYSLISQQPLGGKAQFGGQRFGEMEVWTLEAYSAAHNLQEMLTIKSDDITGRSKTYEAIIKNEEVVQAGVPESFKVLVKELQSLSIAVEIINEEKEITSAEKLDEVSPPESEFEITEGEAIAEDEKERGPGPANEIPEPEAQAKTAEAIAEDEKEREPGPANEIPEPEAQAKTAEATAEEEKEKEPGPANEIPEPEAQAKTAEAKTAEAKTAEAKTAEAIAEGEKEENA